VYCVICNWMPISTHGRDASGNKRRWACFHRLPWTSDHCRSNVHLPFIFGLLLHSLVASVTQSCPAVPDTTKANHQSVHPLAARRADHEMWMRAAVKFRHQTGDAGWMLRDIWSQDRKECFETTLNFYETDIKGSSMKSEKQNSRMGGFL
jgi:hypothetical protein